MQYRDDGYLPHALLNYLVRLGWSHGDQEIFSIARDERAVRPQGRQREGLAPGSGQARLAQPAVPEERRSGRGRASTSSGTCASSGYDLAKGPAPADVVVALRDRVQTLKEMAERAAVWFRPLTHYDDAAVAKHLTAAARAPLADARERLATLPRGRAESVAAALHETAEALGIGMGKVAQPLRVAITGTQVSPESRTRCTWPGRARRWRASTRPLQNCPTGRLNRR